MSKLLCTVFAVTAIAPWSAWSLERWSATAQGNGQNTNPAFAQRIAGTYVEVQPPYSTLMNIRADGTLDWFGSWFFGDGTGEYYDGPVYGSWKQTGPRQITTIELGHLFDGDGAFWATGKVRQVFTWSPDLQTITHIDWEEDLFDPTQNPTDPNAAPFFSFAGTGGPVNRLRHPN